MVEIKFNLNDALAIQKGEKQGQVKTREGLPVRIVCTDAIGYRPIIALVSDGQSEHPMQYTVQGRHDVGREKELLQLAAQAMHPDV